MLEQVSAPVRRYLRARDDTIRCILLAFTDPASELYDEFMHGEPLEPLDDDSSRQLDAACRAAARSLPLDRVAVRDDSDDAMRDDDDHHQNDDDNTDNDKALWQPDPTHAGASSSRAKRRTDTIGLLVLMHVSLIDSTENNKNRLAFLVLPSVLLPSIVVC
jgi:hypothetical protein